MREFDDVLDRGLAALRDAGHQGELYVEERHVLRLAVKGDAPIMTGRMAMRTKFLLPEGDRDVIDKLELAGNFRLEQARFSNVNV